MKQKTRKYNQLWWYNTSDLRKLARLNFVVLQTEGGGGGNRLIMKGSSNV